MSTQAISDDHGFKAFLLNLADADLHTPGKWRLSVRILFCVASAIACWALFVDVAEMMIGI